jgi:hypothetical protein
MTHCGKLGDFMYALPVAAWHYRKHGRKIHWVLPRCFPPFRQIESLLMLQEFSAAVTLVDFPVRDYGCGGQPYRFDPARYGVEGDYVNLGCRGFNDKFITAYMAEEYDFGWDPDWVLNLGNSKEFPRGEPALYTEQPGFPSDGPRIDFSKDILYTARWMAASKERHCAFSGLAALLYFARVPFFLYRHRRNPPTLNYFPDTTRYELRQMALPRMSLRERLADVRSQLLTKWIIWKNNT